MVKRAKSQLKHIPALSPEALELALQKVQELQISAGGKAQLGEMLKAASNPASESAETVIATLNAERRKDVEDLAASLGKQTVGIARRGSKALREMSEAEFQKLVDRANDPDAD